MVWWTYGQHVDFRKSLFTTSIDQLYSINSIRIHQELLVEFSYDLHEILSIEFILVMLLVFVTSNCYNTNLAKKCVISVIILDLRE